MGHRRNRVITLGAQTERRGGAGPAGGLLGGKDPAGRFSASERSVIIQNRAEAAVLGEQRIAAVAEQVDVEGLVRSRQAIAVDRYGDGLAGLAGGEGQRASRGPVVAAGGGAAVGR